MCSQDGDHAKCLSLVCYIRSRNPFLHSALTNMDAGYVDVDAGKIANNQHNSVHNEKIHGAMVLILLLFPLVAVISRDILVQKLIQLLSQHGFVLAIVVLSC